jgi:hypothetical protein
LSTLSATTFFTLPDVLRKYLDLHVEIFRPFLVRGGHSKDLIKKVDAADILKVASLVKLPPDKLFVHLHATCGQTERRQTSWQRVFEVGGWASLNLTSDRLRSAFYASDENDALFVNANGAPTHDFGRGLKLLTQTYAGG